jgi:hypothetical protein
MSLEDIEVARAARATKEIIKGKGKHGRKRKSAALEAYELEIEAKPEVACAAKEAINNSRNRESAAQEADELELEPEPEMARMIKAPEPWRAPVARMT